MSFDRDSLSFQNFQDNNNYDNSLTFCISSKNSVIHFLNKSSISSPFNVTVLGSTQLCPSIYLSKTFSFKLTLHYSISVISKNSFCTCSPIFFNLLICFWFPKFNVSKGQSDIRSVSFWGLTFELFYFNYFLMFGFKILYIKTKQIKVLPTKNLLTRKKTGGLTF